MFKSLLDVTEESLENAVKEIYKSVMSEEAEEYSKTKGIHIEKIKMSIIVQKQIEPKMSGVCFTANPINGKKEYIIEFVQGRSIKFLSGQGQPERLVFGSDLKPRNASRMTSNNDVFYNLLEVCKKIESLFGYPQDIEWAIGSHGTLHILQSRDILPAAKLEKPSDQLIPKSSKVLRGLGLSSGVSTGEAKKIHCNLSREEVKALLGPKKIAVTYNLRIDHLPGISKCAGLVTADASMLSHVAIRTRELGIPCVGGIIDGLFLINDCEEISIDGDKGIVHLSIPKWKPIDDFNNNFVYYNPDRVKTIKSDKEALLLYMTIGDSVIAYVNNIGDRKVRRDAINTLSKKLNIIPEKIIVDRHGLWEGENCPSIVYEQYVNIKALMREKDLAELLNEGQKILRELSASDLKNYIEKVDHKANSLFRKSVLEWGKFRKNRDLKTAEIAASILDQAKKHSGQLIGTVVLDVFGMNALEKHGSRLESKYGITPRDIFVAANNKKLRNNMTERIMDNEDNRLFNNIVQFASILCEYKNKRLDILKVEGYTALDLIRDFYVEGLDDIVSRYNW